MLGEHQETTMSLGDDVVTVPTKRVYGLPHQALHDTNKYPNSKMEHKWQNLMAVREVLGLKILEFKQATDPCPTHSLSAVMRLHALTAHTSTLA